MTYKEILDKLTKHFKDKSVDAVPFQASNNNEALYINLDIYSVTIAIPISSRSPKLIVVPKDWGRHFYLNSVNPYRILNGKFKRHNKPEISSRLYKAIIDPVTGRILKNTFPSEPAILEIRKALLPQSVWFLSEVL
jgi:hypothetical protein